MNKDYYTGRLNAMGIYYHGAEPHSYWVGRMDALKCKPGNTPCGDRCLPKGQKCKTGSGMTLKQGGGLLGPVKNAVGEAWEGNLLSDYRKGGVRRAVKNKIIRNVTSYPLKAAGTVAGLAIANQLRRSRRNTVSEDLY
jgi:hypothetical protein